MANYRAKLTLLCLFLAASLALLAQGPGQVSTVRHGSSLPATCSPTLGQIFFLNNDGLYSCSATNTWTKGGGGGGSWGSITGTLSAQTDLNTALNGKVATTRLVAGHALSADVTISCTDLSNDGDACTKNTGTVTGTLAAGDDSRIVNAVPNTRTVAGKALSTNITLASTDLSDSASVVKTNAAATFGAFSYDFAGSTHFRPVGGLTASKPATCNPPEVYFATDATAGQNWYFCTATNTWTQQLNSGGGGNTTSTSLTTNALSKANGPNSIVTSLFSDDGTNGAYTGTGGFSAPSFTTSGAGPGTLNLTEGTVGSGVAGKDICSADSTAHLIKCSFNADTMIPMGRTVANGTATLGTSAIASGACAAVVTVAATGAVTTDVIVYTPNTDPTAVTGYGPSATGSLYIWAYPTLNNVNFKACNNTSASITPAALTLNWRVAR